MSTSGSLYGCKTIGATSPWSELAPAELGEGSRILRNNLLNDPSEVGIPFDSVDRDELTRPRAWDMSAILRFTLVMGALSSFF